jgi:aminoglycoside/choline kinase family phosphotransferase
MRPRDGAHPFLAGAGWGAATVLPLAGDASFRRYFRVAGSGADAGRTAVLMDAPPPHEDVRPFVAVARWLSGHGFAAPAIFAEDPEQGFLLIADLGDRLLGPELAAERADEADSYARAVDLLLSLQQLPPPSFLAPYDRAALLREAMLFCDWYAPAAGLEVDVPGFVAAWDRVLAPVLGETAAQPVAVLRDFHAENLLLIERDGRPGLGLLDFQDALAGHPAYDLVSLLQDARRTVDPRLEQRMLDRFAAGAGLADAASFRSSYEILGAQRNIKILGIFVRLRDRDGRRGYVERLPRVWAYLDRNLAHPALAPVAEWFAANVPADRRSGWCR